MVRVLALVEGPTERNFGCQVVAPHLGNLGVSFSCRVIGKPGHKGGVGPWERARKEIIGLIRQEPSATHSTMFDLYGLPASWPGQQEVAERGLKHADAACLIEQRIYEAIREEIGDSGPALRFLPYLSVHEYEAFLFSDPEVLAKVTQGADHAAQFRAILEECGKCEKIDDRPERAPSKRILKVAPGYDRTVDGIIAAERIGLQTIRTQCPHFDAWLKRLEQQG